MKKISSYLPTLLLIIVACSQIFFAKYLKQTSWKGGGFGMFSSLDSPHFQKTRIWVFYKGKKIPANFSLKVVDGPLYRNFKARPTLESWNNVADQFKLSLWYLPSIVEKLKLGIKLDSSDFEMAKKKVSEQLSVISFSKGHNIPKEAVLYPKKILLEHYKVKFDSSLFRLSSQKLFQKELFF